MVLLELIVASKAKSSPLESVSFKVNKASTLVLFISELLINLISSSKEIIISVSRATFVDPCAGLIVTVGGSVSVTLNVPEVDDITLFDESSNCWISTKTVSPCIKSESGLIVIIFLSEFIVAVKSIAVLSDTYSSVIKLPKFEFVNSLSFIFLTDSLNVKVTFAVIGIPVAVSAGSKVTTGAVESAAVKVIELALIALSDSSSTVAPIAT